ncbi:transporter substrate-binding domain-containing protein [Nocardioides jensenii]|uniref:transporter substrate-binding domain-containing protein n=1 Tax=Nocardioides jensenii TaxID=1843 RepID=UPI00082F2B36|nr:transporter substrate-binding domain-containing protein [Nocardioides jensenii]
MNLRSVSAVLAAGVLAVSFSGCAKEKDTTTTDSGVKVVEKGTLTICTHLPYEPFEFTEKGEVVGFDIDVLKAVAKAEDLKTNVIDTPWETIVSGKALDNGDCDVATGAMTITDERVAVMDFSDPYFEATQAMLTKAGSSYSSLDDLAGKRIGVQEGTTGETYVEDNLPKDAKKVSYEDSVLMMQAVKNGKVDAAVNDNGLVNYFVKQNPDVEVTTEFKTGEKYGFSVAKGGNPELLKAINAVVGDTATMDALHEKWFGTAAE